MKRDSASLSSRRLLRRRTERPTKMIRVTLLAFAMAVATAAEASAWKKIAVSADGLVTFYADTGSMTQRGAFRRFRLLYDYRQVQQDPDDLTSSQSMTVLASIDCRQQLLGVERLIRYSANMAQGAIVSRSPAEKKIAYRKVASGSIDEQTLKFVCGKAST
jgi:hypothetical protein